MAIQMGLGMGIDIAEAEHVRDAAIRHWQRMQKLGVTEPQKKEFGATIEECKKERDKEPQDPDTSLKDTRLEVEDLVGAYRTAANLVGDGFDGSDVRLERELRVDGRFPI